MLAMQNKPHADQTADSCPDWRLTYVVRVLRGGHCATHAIVKEKQQFTWPGFVRYAVLPEVMPVTLGEGWHRCCAASVTKMFS